MCLSILFIFFRFMFKLFSGSLKRHPNAASCLDSVSGRIFFLFCHLCSAFLVCWGFSIFFSAESENMHACDILYLHQLWSNFNIKMPQIVFLHDWIDATDSKSMAGDKFLLNPSKTECVLPGMPLQLKEFKYLSPWEILAFSSTPIFQLTSILMLDIINTGLPTLIFVTNTESGTFFYIMSFL